VETEKGPKFPEVTTPSEATVQKVARGEKMPPRSARRRESHEKRGPPSEVTSLKVDPRVWQTALSLAAHPRNIEIRSEGVVVVHNHPPPWPRSTTA